MDKAIILAAGASSRFWPLATNFHKAFYKVGDGRTIIEYTVAGLLPQVKEVNIVVGPKDEEKARSLFSSESKVKIHVLQSPTGGGNAILAAFEEKFEGKFFVTGADKVYAGKLLESLSRESEAIAVRKTNETKNFGIVEIDSSENITSVVEKPEEGKAATDTKITSAYLLDSAFLPLLRKFEKEHYSLEIALNEYVSANKVKAVFVDEIPDTSLKFPWDLLDLNKKLMDEGKVNFIAKTAKIAASAVIKPPVYIGENAVVGDFSLIRDCSFIDANAVVGAHSEVKNSLIYEDASIHRSYVGDSVIDENSKLGAGVILANKRYDRGIVKSSVKGERVLTGLKALGAIIGSGASLGTNSTIMPGVKVGNNAIVWPGKVVLEDVSDKQTLK